MKDNLLAVVAVFATLSILSIGGGNTVLPEMQREAVNVHGWLTNSQFADCFAIAQAAPGPSILIVTMLGYAAAGIPGALLASVFMILPAALLMYLVTRLWQHAEKSTWRLVMQKGMAPIAVGLVFASGFLIARAADHNWLAYIATGVSTYVLTATKINPLIVMAVAGGMGAMGWFS